MRELHLFAGAGGGLLASLLLGHRPVCAVEIDPYCRRVLAARRDEGLLPAEMEIHDDVTTFDGHAWRGRVDLVAGGFPCQDISVAGKGAGINGQRSGLFFELLRVVCEVRPRWVFLENVPAITSRGLDRVLGALADLGWDAEWCVLSAADAGAAHLRKRWWCLARHSDGDSAESTESGVRQGSAADALRGGEADVTDAARWQGDGRGRGELARAAGARRCGDAAALAGGADDPDADSGRQQVGGASQLHRGSDASRRDADGLRARNSVAWATQRRLGRAADGLAEWLDSSARGFWAGDWETEPRLAQGQPHRVARLRALGNGQVPQTAAMAFRMLMARYEAGA